MRAPALAVHVTGKCVCEHLQSVRFLAATLVDVFARICDVVLFLGMLLQVEYAKFWELGQKVLFTILVRLLRGGQLIITMRLSNSSLSVL